MAHAWRPARGVTVAAAALVAVALAVAAGGTTPVSAIDPPPGCAPYTTCSSDGDCPPFRGTPRVCVRADCTPSTCGLDPKSCAPTVCTFDCGPQLGACANAPTPTPSPSPAPSCAPYRMCGQGEPPCDRGRVCRFRPCTSSACSVDPVTCAPKTCLGVCFEGKGYCVVAPPTSTPTPTPTRTPCAPYTVCGRGKPPCGRGRRCLRQTCTATACKLDPVTCRATDACTEDCQSDRGYCVDLVRKG